MFSALYPSEHNRNTTLVVAIVLVGLLGSLFHVSAANHDHDITLCLQCSAFHFYYCIAIALCAVLLLAARTAAPSHYASGYSVAVRSASARAPPLSISSC
jgi:hypothetical protein